MTLEKVVANLVQQVEHRFYGKYRGFVIDNADPEQLGRLKLRVPSVLGTEVVTGWAMPCVPYGGEENQGFLFIPEVGAGVWVEFEEGDLEFPIWVGTFWSKPGGKNELPLPNQPDGKEGQIQDPPTRKIIKTKKGHTIQFEDADGQELVMIVEAENGHIITMNKGGITITDGANKNKVTLDSAGITLDAKIIKLGGVEAEMQFVNGTIFKPVMESLMKLIQNHTHMGNLGAPTGSPLPPILPPLEVPLLDKVKGQ